MEKANVIQKAFYRSAAYLKRHSPTMIKAEVAKETYISADGCAIYDASHDDGCEECLFYDEISDRARLCVSK